MKSLRRFGPALVLGLTMAVAGISFAQNANLATDNDKHSCCCTSGCAGDSCEMKKEGATHHATASDKDGCCGCCGDSCNMTKKDGAKNHATQADKGGCCGGDSCQMMKKDGAKNHATSADKKGCCGDSCQMKHDAKTTATTANAVADKHECCCCGESCNMKDMKDKAAKEKP